MAVLRRQQWLGQMRVDVPHLRSLESSISADFDLLAGKILAGGRAVVAKGFEVLMTGAVGSPATSLQINVANGVIIHPEGSESGSIFAVDSDAAPEQLSTTNPQVSGSFSASQVNYVGLDIRRSADSDTTDTVMFLDPDTEEGVARSVPLARTLGYRIVVSTTDFSTTPHVLPIAKVTTDSNNVVTEVEDARQLLFRLGSGGTNPDTQYAYPWPQGRHEVDEGDGFSGGDKAIGSLKECVEALMTRLWELGGGEYWYTPTSDRDVKLAKSPDVLGNQDNFDWTLGSQELEWSGLQVLFANSTALHNVVQDGTATLEDGQCLYVDVDRATDGATLVPVVADRATLGAPTVPGSRFIIAWREGDDVYVRDRDYEVGRAIPVASTTVSGSVKLGYADGDPADPKVAPLDNNGAIDITATGGNSPALIGTGHGTGAGVKGNGNGTGAGVLGENTAGGAAVKGTASHASGYGGHFENTEANGRGAYAKGGDGEFGGTNGGNATRFEGGAGGPGSPNPSSAPGGIGGCGVDAIGGAGGDGGDGLAGISEGGAGGPGAYHEGGAGGVGGSHTLGSSGADGGAGGVGSHGKGGDGGAPGHGSATGGDGGVGVRGEGGDGGAGGFGSDGGAGGHFTGGDGGSGGNGGAGVIAEGGNNAPGVRASAGAGSDYGCYLDSGEYGHASKSYIHHVAPSDIFLGINGASAPQIGYDAGGRPIVEALGAGRGGMVRFNLPLGAVITAITVGVYDTVGATTLSVDVYRMQYQGASSNYDQDEITTAASVVVPSNASNPTWQSVPINQTALTTDGFFYMDFTFAQATSRLVGIRVSYDITKVQPAS